MDIKFSETCQITGLDTIYKHYFNNKKDGVFVEIGAFDGETHSNTSGLADAGWQGVYIEPVKKYAAQCLERHMHNDVVVWCCAAAEKASVQRIEIAGELSTSIDNPRGMYKAAGLADLYDHENKHKVTYAAGIPLDVILDASGIEHDNFDLLVLDCEGMEWPILKSYNINKHSPGMVIVEMHEKSEEWQAIESIKADTVAINEYMDKADYVKIHSDEINTIFVRRGL